MSDPNADQKTFWSDQVGPTWVAQMEAMDAALGPVLDAVLLRAALQPGEHVLDIGCGAGTSTLHAAQSVGADGSALGIDISQSLLSMAQSRANDVKNVAFELTDAQTHTFAKEHADIVLSRFGVMFFADTVAAFSNVALALRPGGRMVFATWGPISNNPYFTMPAGVTKQVFSPMPKSDPDAPGPFAMRDRSKVEATLLDAGLKDIQSEEHSLSLTPDGDVEAVAALLCEIGPAQAALSYFEAGPDDRARLISALVSGLAPYLTPDGVRIPACINIFLATKPG